MTNDDRKDFMEFWKSVMQDDYDKPISPVGLMRAFKNLERFEFADVERAVQIHQNSEAGKFRVTPSHVVTILEGAGEILAARAYERLVNAVSTLGAYEDVVFDDPIIHAIVRDEGGWIKMCEITDKDLPFFKNRFLKLYMALKERRVFDYPKMLTGISNAQNSGKLDNDGKPIAVIPPSLVGDRDKAKQVYQLGQERKSEITHSVDLIAEQTSKMLTHES